MKIPASAEAKTTSAISNNFNGSGIFLLAEIVLSNPEINVVRTTYKNKYMIFIQSKYIN